VALELPAAVRDALDAWRRVAGGTPGAENMPAGLRLLDPDALHVTLCFLGSQPVAQIDAIGSACRSELAGAGSLSLALAEPLWLPPRRPGVLAVRLRDAGERLAAVQTGLASALRNGGWYEIERRPFLPHATVARAGRRERVRPVELTPPAPLEFTGETVTLYRSRTGGSGARYERLATVRLGSG
jgi:RNA 2',3'-cyclic 3'-phosphodiesterase